MKKKKKIGFFFFFFLYKRNFEKSFFLVSFSVLLILWIFSSTAPCNSVFEDANSCWCFNPLRVFAWMESRGIFCFFSSRRRDRDVTVSLGGMPTEEWIQRATNRTDKNMPMRKRRLRTRCFFLFGEGEAFLRSEDTQILYMYMYKFFFFFLGGEEWIDIWFLRIPQTERKEFIQTLIFCF